MPTKRKASTPEPSPEAINENLGKRVKKLRGDHGWSLEELATASGVSRSMLVRVSRVRGLLLRRWCMLIKIVSILWCVNAAVRLWCIRRCITVSGMTVAMVG